jgi:hypothetical protein
MPDAWKCEQCGHENAGGDARCASCGLATVSRRLRLICSATGQSLVTTQTLRIGSALLKRFGDEAVYASEPQFELRRDVSVGAWTLAHCSGAKNATCLAGLRLVNGVAMPLKTGDIVEIGPGKLKMRVELEGA